jgi:cyclophilin family peptidyl-prolyl cis-trans isomerase
MIRRQGPGSPLRVLVFPVLALLCLCGFVWYGFLVDTPVNRRASFGTFEPGKPSPPSPRPTRASTAQSVVAEIDAFIAGQTALRKDLILWRSRLEKPPAPWKFLLNAQYYMRFHTTAGEILARMRPDWAPYHVTVHMYLARAGFFDGSPFHRVIIGFIDQTGGSPEGDHNAFQYDGEFRADVTHDRTGLLSSAHSGPGTDFSQFSFMIGVSHHLDMQYTIFGEVVDFDSLSVLRKINEGGTPGEGAPRIPYRIERVTLE